MIEILIIFFALALLGCMPMRLPLVSSVMSRTNAEGGYLLDYQTTTSAKGLAMLFILVGHISGTFSTVVFSPLPACGVTIFLMLSGFGLSESYHKSGLKHYWQKKITRVLFPYALVISLLLLFQQKEISVVRYILEISGLRTYYWYVGYQMKWYIVFFITMSLWPSRSVWIFAVSAVVMFVTLDSLQVEQTLAFPIGVLASRYKSALVQISRRGLWLILVVSGLVGILFLGIKQMPVVRSLSDTALYHAVYLVQNMGLAVAFITLFSVFPKLSRSTLLIYTGIVSYELYLLHFPFYPYTGGRMLYAVLLVFFALMASGLFYVFNDRISRIISKRLA